jgi:hypothetical protein
MTSPTLGRWATDYTAEALRRAALIEEAFGDFRLHETALTARETLAHLVECTVAYDQISRGEKPDWAPYEGPMEMESLWSEFWERRPDFPIEGDEAMQLHLEFVAFHEWYHIGQLCLMRQAFDPEWKSSSIYRNLHVSLRED